MPIVSLGRAEPSVLIIDDHRTTCRIVRGMLNQMGIRRDVRDGSGENVLELLQDHSPDLVILDWFLGEITGGHVLRLIRRLDEGRSTLTPVVVMTALPRLSIVREVARAGRALCLAKPFSPAELSKRVLALLDEDVAGHRGSRELPLAESLLTPI